jgi:hypothetical protein
MIPAYVKKYFWEINVRELNLKDNADYIIKRILEYGDIKAVRWLFKTVSRKKIKEALLKGRGFSRPTANFFAGILGLDKNKIACLKRSYQKTQKSHWPY